MLKIIKALAVIFMISIVLTGCTARQSLSDLTIVEAVGIDYENGKTKISIQYLNLAKSGGTTEGINTNITSVAFGKADGISDAVADASKKLSKEIFFGQNKIIIFGKDYVEKGIDKGLDYLLRSVDSRPDVLVAMSSDSAEKIIKSSEKDARIPAENLYNLLETGEKNGFGAVVTVDDMLNMYSGKTSDIYLPVLKPEKDNCVVDGIAVFSNELYRKTLDENQSLGFLIMKNKVKSGFISVYDSQLKNVNLEIISSKAKCKMEITDNGYVFHCDIKMNLILDEVQEGITSAIDEEKIKQVEALVNKRVEGLCNYAFNACMENQSDALMLGRYLARENEDIYNLEKKNWRSKLKEVKLEVKVKSDLEKVNDTQLKG